MAGDDAQGVEHGAVRLVVGAEVERVQHQRQHASVMRAVGVVDHGLEVAAVDRPGGLALGHEVMQGLLADGRENHVAHGTVRLGDAGRGQLEQQRRLAGDALEVGNQFALDALLGFRADAVHRGDQQVGEAVGDLALADVAKGGEQGQADRVGVPAQLVQLLGRDPAAVGEHHARRHAIKQAAGQRQGADAPQFVGLLAHALQAGLAGAGAQRKQRGWARSGVLAAVVREWIGCPEQGVEAYGSLGRQAREHGGAEHLFLAMQGGAHQPLQALGRRRLDVQRPAPLSRRGQQPVRPAPQGEHLALKPAGQGRRILLRGLAEAERGADLGAMVADCAAIPVIAAPRRRRHADLASNGIDGGKRHVLGTAWEASLGLE